MSNSPFSSSPAIGRSAAAVDQGLQAFFAGTYKQMTIAMIITGIVSYVFGMDLLAVTKGQPTAFLPAELLTTLFATPLKWAVIFGPLAFVLVFSMMLHKMSASTARLCLYGFSAMMGLSISTIFVRYTGMSIAQAFFATAAGFAALSIWGYTTKRDLSAMGRFMFIGLVGLIVLGVMNIFIQSEPMSLALAAISIFVFAGLTAYDTQKIKTSYLEMRGHASEEDLSRMATIGALELYLDFINMFLAMLRLFGATND